MHCKIQGCSTDEDVIAKVAKLLGSGYRKLNRRHNDKLHWKDVYQTILCGQPAKDLMLKLEPLMGERRKIQLRNAVDNYRPRKIKYTPEVLEEIKELCKTLSQDEVARRFNTARTTVNKIINGRYKV